MSMTIERAINVLRNYEDYIDCNADEYIVVESKLDNSIKIALECMEKSIPKKPNVCLSNGQIFSATCMRCMKPVIEEWISCPYCSGVIDWSEFEI